MPLLLSNEEAAAIRFIIERSPHVSEDDISQNTRDVLIERGYLCWVGGMLVVTSNGICALVRAR